MSTYQTLPTTTTTTQPSQSQSQSTITKPDNTSTAVYNIDSNTNEVKKLKICCACPDTRKIRDECVVTKGQDNCNDVIEQHKKCLRGLGFKI